MNIQYIYVDKDFVVAVKPYGLPTTFKNREDSSECLVSHVFEEYPDVKNVVGYSDFEGGLLYRLDNDTSGLVLFARNQNAFDFLKDKQIHNKVIKKYIAICSPIGEVNVSNLRKLNLGFIKSIYEFKDEKFLNEQKFVDQNFSLNNDINYWIIDKEIGHYRRSDTRMIVLNRKFDYHKGRCFRKSETLFKIINDFEGNKCVDVCIFKGIRHQIRVHLASIGLPILGDRLYKGNRYYRLMLHCYQVMVI